MPKSSSSIADGPRPRRKRPIVPILTAVVAVAVIAAFAGFTWQRRIERETAKTRAYIPAGAPACPTLTRQAYGAGAVKATQAFAMEETTFARAYGHVDCDYLANDSGRSMEDYPVCAFTSPAVLKITTPKGEFYFFPSTGPATVWVPHGVPHCVTASNVDVVSGEPKPPRAARQP